MKTKFVALKEEDVKALQSLISTTEKKTLEREFVLRQIRKEIKATNGALAKTIDENWARFCELHAINMPHVVYNGSSKPTIVDWVKDPEGKFKLERAIKEYRHTDDTENTIVDGCFDGRVVRKVEEKQMVVIEFASGFSKEIPDLDADGKPITTTVDATFVPKEKSTWGFTKTMVEAFLAAADDLLLELKESK